MPVAMTVVEGLRKLVSQQTVQTTEAPIRSIQGNAVNRSERSQVMSWTIPVYVSTKRDPGHEVLVYALLDSGSDTSLISDETLEKLGSVDSRDKMIDMCTLTDVNGKKEKRKEVSALRVRGYKQQKHLDMPIICSQSKIPAAVEQIPNPQSGLMWPHLRHLADQLITNTTEIDIGLLIGSDLSQVFLPRDVISGADHEPFA